MTNLQKIRSMLSEASSVVVLTGAGISVDI